MSNAISLILLLVAVALCQAAPLEESSVKAKRGLHLGLGYHAPLVSSSYVSAPAAVYHSAPVISHAPLIHHAPLISHAPLIAHAPIYSSHHILPSLHAIHHY
ncbi:pupal cuticle protein G1A [Calliphora vicina]|uniref:pupal cuticle protein G1A n=1 Tax=Calliphora vicina TaxID=7373 RepID=UPI00325B7201